MPKPVSDPSLQQMPRPVMLKVAALAPGPKVPRRVPAGIVIEVGSRQNDAGHSLLGHVLQIRPARGTAAAIAPSAEPRVKPAPVGQAAQLHSVWAPAPLAFVPGPLEADAAAAFAPIPRV